jgi:predicted dehydrogenase
MRPFRRATTTNTPTNMSIHTRRSFLGKTGLGLGSALFAGPAILRGQNLNSKIRLACIGVGGKGESDVMENAACGMEVVGLCDVDDGPLRKMAQRFPGAKTYKDFRKMLEEMDKDIDAVTVSTPDHVHGVAGIMAMQMGKHIYCQKPLTQTVWESRVMRTLARDKKLATQMGNQGSAAGGLRRAVELIHAGVIGNPTELHVWSNRPIWPQAFNRPEGSDPVPAGLDWDLWLGPAPERPFKKDIYHAFKWRGWTEFGTGALGDMACHGVNMPFRALKLGYPTRVECEMSSRTYPETSRVRFDFPAREGWPALKFWWYDGAPDGAIAPLRPHADIVWELVQWRRKLPHSGCLIVGDKGKLFAADDYGANSQVMLNGEKSFSSVEQHEACKAVPVSILRSPGHQQEWADMIKGGPPAYSNFEIAAYLNEIILLGCLAQRLGEGVPMDWDGPNMKSPNQPDAAAMVKRTYRAGWEPKA